MEITKDLKAKIEAVLFVSSRPVSLKRLCSIIEEKEEVVKRVIEELKKEYASDERAFQIFEIAGGYIFYTKEKFNIYIKKLKGENKDKMSKAMLETLAIIAYKQPITKGEIEKIRGISVDWTLKGLIERGLVRPVGRKNTPGRPLLYGTTDKFLKVFGLNSLDELPRVE